MTVLEGIQKSAEFLAGKGVETPRLQAELLLAHILGLPRMNLYLNFERALSDSEIDRLRDAVRRRGRREPLQHIIGTVNFCGLELAVNRHVLVPRPETEVLAERSWSLLAEIPRETRVLDFGTGSGCLAIAIAAKVPQSRFIALDRSPEALEIARQNALRHHVEDRIEFIQRNSLADATALETLDLIVSNPPYIATAEIAQLDPEVRDFDPHMALDGGADGLDFYRMFASEAAGCLKPDGRLIVEFGDDQADRICELFKRQNWIVDEIVEDYTHRPRILVARPERA